MNHSDVIGLITYLPEEIQSYLEEATYFKNPEYHSKRRELQVYMEVQKVLPREIYERIIQQLKLNLHVSVFLKIQARDKNIAMDELDQYVSYFVEKDPKLKSFRFLHPYEEENSVVFSTKDEERLSSMNRALKRLKEYLGEVGVQKNIVVKYSADDEAIEVNHIQLAPEPVKQEVKTYQKSNYSYKKEAAKVLKISELEVGMNNVAIEGHIFDIEERVLRSEKTLQMIYISDYEEAIVAKRFEGKRCTLDEMHEIQKGMSVRITGSVVFDAYAKTDSFMVSKLEPITVPKREDTEPVKRTEWHVHSNFSEMDGVCQIEEYIQTAYDWGMDSIGVCDHQVVQAFPMAQHKVSALNKANPNRKFKMLYGCEMVMVDPEYKIIYNNDHRKLEDATYVVFDLETTGLSNRLDEIIEFGAVKMKNREVVSRKQMFINPKRTIPAHITRLTHIAQSDVDGAKPIEDSIDELLEFIGDSVLVAHNATFDVLFFGKPHS